MQTVVKERQGNSHQASHSKMPLRQAKNGPVRIIIPHPLAWYAASCLAGGNVKRLFTVRDGVIVANTTRRPKWVG